MSALSAILPRQLLRISLGLAALTLADARAQPADPAPGNWGKRAELIEPNSEFSVASFGNKIYVLGGYPSGRVTVRTVQVYDVKADKWEIGPPLPMPNNHGMAAAIDGVVYLIGGQTDPNVAYVETVYALDLKTGQWTTKAPMPTKRSAGIAEIIDGKIYVVGGRPPRGHDFAVYDPKADSWEKLPDLPTQRNHIAGAVINGKLYVAGGRLEGGFQSDKTSTFEVYDPKTRTWTKAAPMLKPRSGINGVLAFGCFHVWGGEEGSGLFPDHDVYDPRSDKWTKLANMPQPVHGVTGAAFIDGLIFVPGGGNAPGGSSGTKWNQTYRPNMRCD